jgi:hypothetical protein
MKRIIYTQEDGSAAVVIPTGETTLEHIIANDLPDGVAYEVVEIEAIPTDRTFRNAWVKDEKSIKTDLPKAKEIAHEIRRYVRAKKFAPLDIQATIPSQAAQAEAARQVIRDADAVVQGNINAAADVDSLKAVIMAYRAEVE